MTTGSPTRATGARAPDRQSVRFWAVELIPQYVLGATTLFFATTKWNAVRSAFGSTQAVALNAAVAIGWLVFSLVFMPLVVPRQWVRVGASTVAAGVLAWVMFANAYRDTKVVESLRGLGAPAVDTNERFVPSAPPGAATTVAPATEPAVPVRLRSAPLRGIDHRASGTASIIRRPDGGFLVGLEDIDIEPGPDYRVYVVPGDTERTRTGAVELDSLRGNVGTQYYDVPSGVAVGEGEWTVLIWCKRFAVPIAAVVPV